MERFPYRPTRVVDSVADLVELVEQWNDIGPDRVVDFAT